MSVTFTGVLITTHDFYTLCFKITNTFSCINLLNLDGSAQNNQMLRNFLEFNRFNATLSMWWWWLGGGQQRKEQNNQEKKYLEKFNKNEQKRKKSNKIKKIIPKKINKLSKN